MPLNQQPELKAAGRLLTKLAHSPYKTAQVAVLVILVGIGGDLAIKYFNDAILANDPKTYTYQSGTTTQGATSTPASAVNWVSYTQPTTGYKWALAVTKINIATSAASASDAAVPQGMEQVSVDVAIQNRTNGAVGIPLDWFYGQPISTSCTSTPGDAEYGAAPGNPNECWNQVENFMLTDASGNVTSDSNPLAETVPGGQTLYGQFSLGNLTPQQAQNIPIGYLDNLGHSNDLENFTALNADIVNLPVPQSN